MDDDACFSSLSHEQAIGLSIISQSGLISSVAVVAFLISVLRNYIRNIRHPPPGGWKLIRTHVEAYMLSLLLANLLQGIGTVLSMKWAMEQKTYCSSYCTAQGVLQQMGQTGATMSTLVITINTFSTVFFRAEPPRWVWVSIVSGIWSFLGVMAGISTLRSDRSFYGPTPFWCWISDSYGPHKVVSEYAWLWVTIFINIIACILVFLCVRGNINVHPVSHEITFSWRTSFNWIRRWSSQTGLMGVHAMVANKSNDTMKSRKTRNREALMLIWYPLSYTILVLPMSIVRWSTLPAQPVRTMPITMAVITNFAFGLSGFVNVFIFLLTRPTLLLFGQRRGSVYEYPDHRPSPSASTDSLATTTGWLTPGSTGTPFFHKSSEMFMSRPVTPLSTDRSSVLSYPEEPYFGCPPSRSNAAVGSFSYRTDSGRRKYEDSHVDEAFFSHPIDLKRCQGQSHQGAVTRSEHGALTSENVLVRGTSQGDAMDDDTIVGYYTMEHWQLPEDCSTSRR